MALLQDPELPHSAGPRPLGFLSERRGTPATLSAWGSTWSLLSTLQSTVHSAGARLR